MFHYDYSQPGPSHETGYTNDSLNIYDYPHRNTGPLTGENIRQNHRGARQGFNMFHQNQNRLVGFQPWVPPPLRTYPNDPKKQQYQQKQQFQQKQQKDKRRDFNSFRDKNAKENQNISNYSPFSTDLVSSNELKKQQFQQYQPKHKSRDFSQNRDNDKTFTPAQWQTKKNKGNNQEDDKDKHTSTLVCKEIDYRLYKCPNCTLQFDFFSRYSSYIGRVPLILNCKHTLCQECIFKLGKDCSVLCPVCKNPSVLPSKYNLDDLQDIFSPNFFLIGFIMWCKAQGNNPNFMTLVPVQNPLKKKPSPVLSQLSSQHSVTETCCFLSCNKPATLHCKDCSDVYCSDCSKNVHKSAKSLWSHKQFPLNASTKSTLELEKCSEHNMDLEFYCTTCETSACCYCCVEKHESHTRENLVKLTEEEMQELQTNKKKAKNLLKQLLISQRRLRDLYNCSTSNIEKKISSYFVNYHAKLQFIEKNLKKELANYTSGGLAIDDVDELNNQLLTSIEDLTNVVAFSETMEIKKLNLKELFKRLKKVQDVPSYLISESGKGLEPLEFDVDVLANNLEDFFKITKSENCNFKLVTEDDLPPDFEKYSLEQYESDVESSISSIGKAAVSEEEKPKKKPVHRRATVNQVPLENEMVEITHIESLECFYVRLKKIQYQFSQMNRDINDYIKMGAPTVEHPELNELYLAMYQTKNEKIWCRGRVTELKNGETEPLYEVFFIDYGSTQTVDISRLRQITSSLADKKPFAIHCELYNPSMASWGKNAHVYMAKMLNGKQVTMLVKKVHSGVHEVDLMILSSDRGQTSIIDILIHTCTNAFSNSDNESISSNPKFTFNTGYKIFGNSTVFHKLQEEKVIIVNVIDPHHIFVHLASHAENLKKLNESLKFRYKHSQKNNCHPVEGTYVIVDYKDQIRGNLHRGLIKKVDFEKCQVLLVDWGLNIIVPWTSIRAIQEEFIRLESQAILVKLAHVEPIDKGSWLESASTFLQKYYRNQDVMRMIVHETDPLEVGLFEIVGDIDISVNALLVEENYAECTGKISQVVQWPRGDAALETFAEDDGLVASLLKQVESLEDESEDEEMKGAPKQKIEVVKFVSPDLIYIKFAINEPNEMSLYRDLQIHYSKERMTKTSWKPEQKCVVLYNLSYSRAKIVEKVDKDKYKVDVADRAAVTVLPIEKIYEFNKYFNKYPNVVFKSHLANIRPAGGETWSGSSIEALERIFDKYKDICGTKVEGDTSDKSMPMHMWYTQVKIGGALEASQTKFVSLNNLLVKLGFAYKMTYKKPESIKSDSSSKKSTSSKSDSPFISAIEKTALNASSSTVDGHDTDQDSIPDIKADESSTSEPKDVEEPATSSKASEKSNMSIDWNVLMEEEEKKRRKKNKKNRDEKDSPYRTQEAEITDWIPAFAIEEMEFKAWITCAETGGIIYLREEKLQTVYKQMEENIKQYFDKKPKSEVKHNWEPGQLCTIQYNDYYYRGKVYKVNGPDDITAVMIDFGSDHTISEKYLNREILYPKIPAFASKVKLDKVYAKSGSWMDSDYEALLETLSEYSKIIIKGPLDVDIPSAEVFTDKGVNVNETIVKMCPNLTRNIQTLDDELDDAIVIEENDDDAGAVIIEEKEEFEHVKQDDPPVDTTKYKYEVLELSDNDTDERLEVSIMFVVDYNKIALKEARTVTDEFFSLGDRIQEEIHKQPVIEKVEVGMPCVCPFSEDGRWYRAQIYDTNGMEECEFVFVFFVDFGNVESVAVGDIKMMRAEWFELPVSCHIAELHIAINADKNIQHVTQHMKKLYGKNKFAKIVSRDPLRVSLHEPDGELCYESLLKKGLIKVIA